MITNLKTTDGATWLQGLQQLVLVASLLVGLVVLGSPDSKADTVTSTVVSQTNNVLSEETTITSQGAGLELHTTTVVTEQTTVSDQKTVGDQETTANYLTNPGFQTGNINGWTLEQGQTQVCQTCGPFGGKALKTQGEDGPGGTVSQTVDLFSKMTEAEVQHGFNLKYGAHVHSDESNVFVPVCDANPSNGPDCRDTFSIALGIKDSAGNVLHNFVHTFEEITFQGWNTTDFFFQQTIPSNQYTSAFATLALFGIDSGFPDDFFGPYFDNAIVQAIHNDVVLQQITSIQQIISVTEELVQTAITTIEDTSSIATDVLSEPTVEPIESFEAQTIEVFEVSVSDNFSDTMQSFEVSIDTNLEITIEPIVVAAPVEMVENTVSQVTAEVETQVAEVTEMEINNDISNNMEPSGQPAEQAPAEQAEPTSSSDDTTTEEPESQEDTRSTESQSDEGPEETKTAEVKEQEPEEKESESEPKAKSEPKTKDEIKREIAPKVVQNIVTRLGESPQDQATQVALMNLISADITANQPVLQDQSQWYQATTVYNNQSIATNNKAQYYMFGGSDAAMNRLVDTQYK